MASRSTRRRRPRVASAAQAANGSEGADTREKIIVAAERLIGQRGIHGVSLRQVGADAGQSNNSAVQYHFGDKETLVQAVFAHRMRGINARRHALLDALVRPDARTLFRVLYLPLVELLSTGDTHFLSFLARVHADAEYEALTRRDPAITSGFLEVFARLAKHTRKLPREVFAQRLWFTNHLMIVILCQWEQRVRRLGPSAMVPLDQLLETLTDYAVAGLQGPHAGRRITRGAQVPGRPRRRSRPTPGAPARRR